MKCPKCSYLSFETGDRCRNCGYDFSLSAARPLVADVSIAEADESEAPLDLALSDRPLPSTTPEEPSIDLDRIIGAPAVPDLPLFARDHDDYGERPLISTPAAPRAPLAVRRTADSGRLRAVARREGPLELALELPPPDAIRPAAREAAPSALELSPSSAAGWLRRVSAALIDLSILSGIDALVMYFTLQLCGLDVGQAGILPPIPMLAFLLMLNGGYLVAFTAMGGQTIGKMAVGIQVVRDEGPVDFAHALLRAAAYIVSLLPVGLGVVPALFGEDRRTLHDRLADTRVVRA